MQIVEIEACIDSPNPAITSQGVRAAYEGGAATVELCAAMDVQGLTPPPHHVAAAREAFQERRGLMVMIRPRAGDFCYSKSEAAVMTAQIASAASAGADGVVFGALTPEGALDRRTLESLMEAARRAGLRVTFHRAFDALADPLATLDELARLGVDRVLTSGIPWGEPGTALEGVDRLAETVRAAAGRMEVVVGGGVTSANVGAILRGLPLEAGRVSVHAYSGVREGGRTTAAAVRKLVGMTADGGRLTAEG